MDVSTHACVWRAGRRRGGDGIREEKGYKVELEIIVTARRNSGGEELSHVYKSN